MESFEDPDWMIRGIKEEQYDIYIMDIRMEKEILVLNTIGFFLETALGIWIFSQAFPRHKEVVWEWRVILAEALLHGLLLFIKEYILMKTGKNERKDEIILELEEAEKLTERREDITVKASSIFGGPYMTVICC